MKKLLLLAAFAAAPIFAQVPCGHPVCIEAPIGPFGASSGGIFSASPTNEKFIATISATGTPDQFTWTKNDGTASSAVAITGGSCAAPQAAGTNGWQALADGVLICWNSSTGHTLGDSWTIFTQTYGSLVQTIAPRGVGGRTAETATVLNSITLTPEMFGGHRGKDSTAAFQRMFDWAAKSSRTVRIYVPPGDADAADGLSNCYLTSANIVFHPFTYSPSLYMEGATAAGNFLSGSCLLYTGPVADTMLEIDGGLNDVIRNITLNGNGLITGRVLWFDSFSNMFPTAVGIAYPLIENVNILGYTGNNSSGIQVAHDTNPPNSFQPSGGPCSAVSPRIDTFTFRHVNITGPGSNDGTGPSGTAGLRWLCGGNVERVAIYDSFFGYNESNLLFVNPDSVSIYSSNLFYATGQDIKTSGGIFFITGSHTENSARLLVAVSGSGNHLSVHLSGHSFSSGLMPSDSYAIENWGRLIVENSFFRNFTTAGAVAKIATVCAPITTTICGIATSVRSNGNTFTNATASGATYPFVQGSIGGGTPIPFTDIIPDSPDNPMAFSSSGDRGGPDAITGILTPLPELSPQSVMLYGSPAPGFSSPCSPRQVIYATSDGTSFGTPYLYVCTATNQWARVQLTNGSTPAAGPQWIADATGTNLVSGTGVNVCLNIGSSSTCSDVFNAHGPSSSLKFPDADGYTFTDGIRATVYQSTSKLDGSIACWKNDGAGHQTLGWESSTSGPCN